MTTPATPAADAVSLDSEAPTMRDWIVAIGHAHDESLDDLHASARLILRGVISEMKEHEATATARESALVAERDALRAALISLRDRLVACSEMPVSAAEAFDSFYQSEVDEALALAAPAVEGE